MKTRVTLFTVVLMMGWFGFSTSSAQDPYGNYFLNGGFEEGVLEPWGIFGEATGEVVGELSGAVVPEGPAEGDFALHVTVHAGNADWWTTGLSPAGMVFEKGKKYTVSAFMKCKAGSFQVDIKPQQLADPWPGFGQETFTITEEWAEYSVTTPVFTEDTTPAAVTFHTGFAAGEFWIDGVRFYEGDYVPPVVVIRKTAGKPRPGHGATDVALDQELTWHPGGYAVSHDVYFGTNADDVNDASRARPGDVLVSLGQVETSYTPVEMNLDQTYYWRVDEVNENSETIFKGVVWSFEAEPTAFPVTPIAVTASSRFNAESGPEKTIDGSGLNEAGQHSTISSDMWMSAENDLSGTWIQYEFDGIQKLHQMKVWNSNQTLESFVGVGVKSATLETSLDGKTWAPLGEAVEFARASGTDGYVSNTTIDLAGAMAKFLKINCLENWGQGVFLKGKSLSEVRFTAIPVAARRPEPASGANLESLNDSLVWRAGRGAEQHQLYIDVNEALVTSGDGRVLVGILSERRYDLGLLDLFYGETYSWKVVEMAGDEIADGPVWSFHTPEYLSVDDMESYDDEDALIYSRWIDGWDSDENGSTVGHLVAPFAEETIVYGDRGQSMPFYYDNLGSASLSMATLSPGGQDWTAGNLRTLSLFFYGDTDNTGQLFLEINGIRVDYDGNPGDLKRPQWQAWQVDLNTVDGNLGSVTSLAIGVEGGRGLLFIDEISVYPRTIEQILPVEPDSAGLVVHYTFDEGSGTSIGDSSGSGNDATFYGPVDWVPGVSGTAVHFNGFDNYVGTDQRLLDSLTEFTISCWLKGDLSQADRSGLIGQNDCIEYAVATANTIEIWTPMGGAMQYAWPYREDEQWHQITAVGDGTSLASYVDGKLAARGGSSTAGGSYGTSPDFVNMGGGGVSDATGNWITAEMDDVRIYHRALSPAEVAGLAGLTLPLYSPF